MNHRLLSLNSESTGSVGIPAAFQGRMQWVHCPSCEAPCRDKDLPKGTELRCRRCSTRVKIARCNYSLQPSLAFSTAGLLAAVLANLNPILTFDVVGDTQSGMIFTGVMALYEQGYWPLAILVFFASILAPILFLAFMWYASAACVFRLRLPFVEEAIECVSIMDPWNLVPVYAIATVVSVVKLRMLGSVEWQFGARWVLGMAFFSLLAANSFDCKLVREKLEELRNK